MLPHDTAYRKKQALPHHMAGWLPQSSSTGFHAHPEHLLGFRHRAATSLSNGPPTLKGAGKLGSDRAKATQLSRVPSTKAEKWQVCGGAQ